MLKRWSISCVIATKSVCLTLCLPHSQWGEEGSARFQYEELREEVHGALDEVLRVRRESEEQTSRILNAEDLEEANQLYLIHQVSVMRKVMSTVYRCLIYRSFYQKVTSDHTEMSWCFESEQNLKCLALQRKKVF